MKTKDQNNFASDTKGERERERKKTSAIEVVRDKNTSRFRQDKDVIYLKAHSD